MPAQLTRDQGLARVSRTTRWVAAGALVVAGMFTALVARATPGRATTTTPAAGSTPSTTPAPASTGDPGTAGSASPDQTTTTLSPPVQAPAPSQAPAAVSSGGS